MYIYIYDKDIVNKNFVKLEVLQKDFVGGYFIFCFVFLDYC